MVEKTDNNQNLSPLLDTLVDFVTGRVVPDIGTESHRQKVERFLVTDRGYGKSDIAVDADIVVLFPEEVYRSQLDLVVFVDGRSFMVIKCVAGALESWQREVLSAARIYPSGPILYAAVADGETAVVYDSRTGKKLGEGLAAIPDIRTARTVVSVAAPIDIPEKRLEKERIIFRSYDSMNIHVQRRMIAPSHPGK
jgi:hypothetical protein